MNTKQVIWGIIIIVVLLGLAVLISNLGDKDDNQDTDSATTTEEAVLEGSGTYTVDPAGTTLEWEARKTLIADYTDRGTIGVESGTVTVEDGEVVGGTVVFDMTSITATETSNTKVGVDKLTGHLASDDFFAVETYPTATLQIESVEESAAGETVVEGTLTMKGKTNPVSFPARVYSMNGDLVVDAEVTIDRTLWDIRFGSDNFFDNLGDNVIDDEFTVDVHLVAHPANAAE
jgi:polyisoprenoid-binding protein YceI